MQIAISTCKREVPYLQETLSSLLARKGKGSLFIRIVVCGTELDSDISELLEEIIVREPDTLICVEYTPEKHWEILSKLDPIRRTFYNTMRCLEGASDGDLLYLQDDVVFVRNWTNRLKEARDAVRHKEDQFILSLFSTYKFHRLDILGPIAKYQTRKFCGAQGLYFPGNVLELFAKEMYNAWQAALDSGNWPEPDDMFLKVFCIKTGIPIWYVYPNIIQHIGCKSAISGSHSGVYRSPSFKE